MKRMLIALVAAPIVAMAAPKELVDVQVYPKDANIFTQRGKQSLVLQAKYSDSTTRDVTAEAKYTFADPKFAKLDKGTLLPLADGETTLKIEFGGRTLSVPVKVKDAAKERSVTFSMDVMPVFTKGGCNAGSCHGSTRGKDKFRLSLFGFDPQRDYFCLTREEFGRRINTARPDDALIIEKAVGRVTHTGGKIFEEKSWMYDNLVEWLAAGAPNDPANTPKVVDLEIYPKQAVLEGPDTLQQLTVRAKYSDGTDRDVTRETVFISNNGIAAKADPNGLITSGKPGEAFIMARFDQITTGTQIISIPKLPDYKFPDEPAANYIDTLVYNKHKKIRITPSGLCDDNTFIRRVYLDVIGQLPEAAAVEKFVTDKSSDKRAKLVEELLGRPEFVKMWVMKWAELLQIRTNNNQFQYKNAILYFEWLRSQFEKNRPMNEIVQELLGARGGTFSNPAGNYYQIQRDALKLMENTAQIFMGMRIQCAQCHNHPFDRWTMDDYYSFANFFSQIGRKGSEDNREQIIYNRGSGGVRHPVGNRDMQPKFLGGEAPDTAGKDRREVLAKWLASDENPFFAKNMANIVWGHFMGVGIVEPVDDVRISNPPSNPELLDELGQRFAKSGYDFKQLVRDICNSRTYQRTVQSNDSNKEDTLNFAKASIRRVRAEVLLDIISQVTDTQNKFRGLPNGASAVEIVDGRTSTFFLTTFGRATRDTVCSCEVALEPNLSQALHLLNGSTVNAKCTQGGVVTKALAAKKTPSQVIDDLYLRCLARKPSAAEKAKLMAFVGEEGRSDTDVLNDLFWAILNSKEFIFNH
ncbi:MAG: DUF1549 and DUF1553 domain-containing protein [Verrucomicrobiota bacterium]|nr:DUF1549 and DUF1553 domain-containing protein [Verrucomicrobiota bacterium]